MIDLYGKSIMPTLAYLSRIDFSSPLPYLKKNQCVQIQIALRIRKWPCGVYHNAGYP